MADDEQTVEETFATTTTLHGVQYIATSKSIIVKIIWLIVFFGGFGMCSWQILLRIDEYDDFKVNTEVILAFYEEMEFPAVTICNFNRYRKSTLTDNDFAIINYLWETEDYGYYSESDSVSVDDYEYIFGTEPFNTSEFTRRTGFQFNNYTVKECFWLDKYCYADNFTHSFTSYGNCYTFNSGQDGNHSSLKVKQPGSGNGLQIMIDIQQHEYTENTDGYIEAGLKILVHDQHEPPLIESKGISISPGFHAFVAAKRLKVDNLDPPHGECQPNRKLKYFDIYTLSGCYIECRLERILSECGCRPIRYPGHERECSPIETGGCAKDTLKRIKNGSLPRCDCPVPCTYVTYETSVNYALIPSKSVENDLTALYEVPLSYIKENYILLDIYYEDLNFQEYKQSPAMEFSALLSDIGGQLGLFIGASVLTFAEIGQYLVMKIRGVFIRKKKIRPVTVVIDNNKQLELVDVE